MSTPWSKLGAQFLRDETDSHTGPWAVGQGVDAPDRVLLRNLLKEFGPCDLLDVGCGTAITLDGILGDSEIICDYTGIDFTPEFVEANQQRHPRVPFFCRSLYDLRDEQFDVVTARGVLEHVHDPAMALVRLFDACTKLLLVAFFIAPGEYEREITEDGFIQQRCDREELLEQATLLGTCVVSHPLRHADQDWEVWEMWRK